MYYKQLPKNNKGRDFVVSDIHGCYSLLLKKLNEISFDSTKDRLFIIGDLIDRGSQNLECLNLLKKDWVYATMGNHEYMLLNFLNNQDEDLFILNGGDWVLDVNKNFLNKYKPLLENLPLLIETTVKDKTVGFVHADIQNWTTTKKLLLDSTKPFHTNYQSAMSLIWSRRRIQNNDMSITPGIDLVFLGHTPQKDIKILGNNIYIDTGAVFGGKLTLIELNKYV